MSVQQGELAKYTACPKTHTSALSRSTESVNTSLRAVAPLNTTAQSSLPPVLPGLAESLAQLLKQLHYQVTSVSLSFKPPITPAAAVATLDKLTDTFGRVAACVVAVTGGKDGGALVSEWKEGVESTGGEILRLFEVLGAAAENDARGEGASKTSNEDNPYLIHTGLVWEAIDRLSKDLSATEVDAVGKRWKGQGEVMKDAWSEFKEFLEEQDEDEDDEEADNDEDDFGLDEDDEFAELEGMMKGGKMTPQERSRAEAVSVSKRFLESGQLTDRQNRSSACIRSCKRQYRDTSLSWCSSRKSHIARSWTQAPRFRLLSIPPWLPCIPRRRRRRSKRL